MSDACQHRAFRIGMFDLLHSIHLFLCEDFDGVIPHVVFRSDCPFVEFSDEAVSGAGGVRTQMYPTEATGSKCTVDDEIVERVTAGGPWGILDLDNGLGGFEGHGICGCLRGCLLLLESLETLVLVSLVELVVWHCVTRNFKDEVVLVG
jgi:hypothetical protein